MPVASVVAHFVTVTGVLSFAFLMAGLDLLLLRASPDSNLFMKYWSVIKHFFCGYHIYQITCAYFFYFRMIFFSISPVE